MNQVSIPCNFFRSFQICFYFFPATLTSRDRFGSQPFKPVRWWPEGPKPGRILLLWGEFFLFIVEKRLRYQIGCIFSPLFESVVSFYPRRLVFEIFFNTGQNTGDTEKVPMQKRCRILSLIWCFRQTCRKCKGFFYINIFWLQNLKIQIFTKNQFS